MESVSEPEDAAPSADVSLYWPENAAAHAEWALKHYGDQMRRMAWLRDDTIPCLNLLGGTEIFAECLGCPVLRKDTAMPFALPAVRSAEEAVKIKKPNLMDTPLRVQFDKADYVHRREPEALLHLPDIQSPLDVAALVWEKGEFYCAVIEEPEAVRQLCEVCYELICDFLDEWFDRYGTEYVAHYPDYPMHGGITLSEDEIGIINRELFEAFSLPYLNRLSRRYGGIGIHCCANSQHQWPSLLKVEGLKMLNLNQPEQVMEKAIPFFAAHTTQYPMGISREELSNPAFRHAHIVQGVSAGNMDRAQLVDTLARMRG